VADCRLRRPTMRDTQMPLYHAAVDLAFVTDDAAKMLKMQHIFAYNELPWGGGYCPMSYIFKKPSSS